MCGIYGCNTSFRCIKAHTQLWAIDPSLLLVHTCGIIYHFISVTLNYRFSSFAENAFVWLKIAASSNLLLDVVRLINVLILTYLHESSTNSLS